MERLSYVFVFVDGTYQLWPYPEAQEFCSCKFKKHEILFLTLEEFYIIYDILKELQRKEMKD